MATKSISKNIVIKDNDTAERLVSALEQAGKSESENQHDVVYSYAGANEINTILCVAEK